MKSECEMIDYIQNNDDISIFDEEIKQLELIIFKHLEVDMKTI
jgi:hypothetical protein